MIIHGAAGKFLRISKTPIEDARLSVDALAVLVFQLSRPPGWKPRLDRLAGPRKIGRDRAQAIMKELINEGYAARRQVRSKDGRRFGVFEYVISDDPEALRLFTSEQPGFQVAESVRSENQVAVDSQQPDSQRAENQVAYKETESNKRTESKEQQPDFQVAENDDEALLARLVEAAKLDRQRMPGPMRNVAPIRELIAEGFDLDADIFPTIRKRSGTGGGRKAVSWNWFAVAVRDAAKPSRRADGEGPREPTTWIGRDDPRWAEAARLWREEERRSVDPPDYDRNGWRFPSRWFEASAAGE